jgi:signal transduction histidine kinase
VLLSENVTFYARLGRSMVMQRREREGRLLSMDVMSAAIAHEINQPLTAIVANADVGLISLAKRPPNLDLIHDALTDIAAEGSRVHDAIEAVRAMFKNKKSPAQHSLRVGRCSMATSSFERQSRLFDRSWMKPKLWFCSISTQSFLSSSLIEDSCNK